MQTQKRPSVATNLSSGKDENDKGEKRKVDDTIRTIEIAGVKSYMEAKSKWAKYFWLGLLLVCTGVLIQQLYKTISNYIQSPIISTYTIKTVNDMAFPVVYICPTSLISNTYLNKTPAAEREALRLKKEMGLIWDYTKFLATGNLAEPYNSTIADRLSHVVPSAFQSMIKSGPSSHHQWEELDEDANATMDSLREADEFFFNATVPLADHVRHCEFRKFLFENLNCRQITREVLDPDFGKCYLLDLGNRTQQVQSQGLILVFNVRSNLYPKSTLLAPVFNGIYVSIEKSYNVKGTGERILIAPKTYNRIDLSMQKQQFKSFRHPYVQECAGENEFQYEIFNVNYTQQSCQYDCVSRHIVEKCECLLPIDRSLYKSHIANTTSEFCKNRHLECIRDKVHKDPICSREIEECRRGCKVPCSDWRYDVRATSMDLYPPSFEPNQVVPDIMYLLVAFSHMEYTQFTQDESTTPDEMIANIGGEMGLWIGASMMTLVQLPLSLATLCGLCCVKKAKQAKQAAKARRQPISPRGLDGTYITRHNSI